MSLCRAVNSTWPGQRIKMAGQNIDWMDDVCNLKKWAYCSENVALIWIIIDFWFYKWTTFFLEEYLIDFFAENFLIQGEVEQIALMKPKALQEGDEGMLEYLEDIIGSSRLVSFIEMLNRKCEGLNEIRTEKVTII